MQQPVLARSAHQIKTHNRMTTYVSVTVVVAVLGEKSCISTTPDGFIRALPGKQGSMELHASTDVAGYHNQIIPPHDRLHSIQPQQRVHKRFFTQLVGWALKPGAARRLARQSDNTGTASLNTNECGYYPNLTLCP